MNESKFASLWTRTLGGAIDVAILFVFTYVACYIWTSNADPNEAYSSYEYAQHLWKSRFILTWLISDLIYSVVLMTSDMQATFGQKLVGIKIVKDNGEKIGYGAAIGRNLMSIISSIFFKIGYVIAIVRKDNKTLHDLVAGTLVIYTEKSLLANTSTFSSSNKKNDFETQKFINQKTKVIPSTAVSKQIPTYKTEPDTNHIWELVANEFEGTNRKKGLYTKLFAETNGDETKIKAFYYKARFEELLRDQTLAVQQFEINRIAEIQEKEPIGEGRNGRQALADEECITNGYFEKFMMNGYECFDLDNGKAMVLTAKRKLIFKSLNSLKLSMDEQSKSGIFTNSYSEIVLNPLAKDVPIKKTQFDNSIFVPPFM